MPSTAFEGRKDLSAYASAARDTAGPARRLAGERVGCVIAGTQKGGTTALASYLYDHPEVSIPGKKEVHFFDTEQMFAGVADNYERYHAAFSPSGRERLLCDATPIYMYWDAAPERIWRYNPAMKWIFVLRNPLTRAYSHWNMQRIKRRDPLPFLEALRTERERCREVLPLQHPWFSYADRGYYVQQLRRVWRYFPERQTLALRSEDLRLRPAVALAQVATFLGIEPFPATQSRDVYSIPYADDIDAAARQFLHATFEYEIRALERTLGWDCGDWLA
jgi:hypothetical protein